MEASNLGTPSKRIVILLHAVHDCLDGRTAAIARHVSFAQIICLMFGNAKKSQIFVLSGMCVVTRGHFVTIKISSRGSWGGILEAAPYLPSGAAHAKMYKQDNI